MSGQSSKRNLAERLYINEGWTNKAIADFVDVSENTIGNWIKKFSWKEQKDALYTAPHQVKRILYADFISVLEGNEPKLNPKIIREYTLSLERIDNSISVQTYVSVMKKFTDWTTTQDLDADTLITNVNLTKGFIKDQLDNE